MKYKSKLARSPIIQEVPLTMLELRQNSGAVMRGLKKGIKYRLTFRGRTVGRIVPDDEATGKIPKDDPIFHLDDYAGHGPAGRLTNEEIDRLVYGL